jgi:hypothetical protein
VALGEGLGVGLDGGVGVGPGVGDGPGGGFCAGGGFCVGGRFWVGLGDGSGVGSDSDPHPERAAATTSVGIPKRLKYRMSVCQLSFPLPIRKRCNMTFCQRSYVKETESSSFIIQSFLWLKRRVACMFPLNLPALVRLDRHQVGRAVRWHDNELPTLEVRYPLQDRSQDTIP